MKKNSIALTEDQVRRFRELMDRKAGMKLALKAAMQNAADELGHVNRMERAVWDEILTSEHRMQGEWLADIDAGVVRVRGTLETPDYTDG